MISNMQRLVSAVPDYINDALKIKWHVPSDMVKQKRDEILERDILLIDISDFSPHIVG